MKSFHKMAGAARNRLFRRSVKKQAERMDPAVRAAVVDDVTPAQGLQQELEQIETEIKTARESLQKAEEKEVFLGQRSRQYRRAQDERARQLKDEQTRLDALPRGNGDEENQAQEELDKKTIKWEQDEDALNQVIETHKQILAHCETIRRKLKELESKRAKCRAMIAECTDFLDAAQDVQNEMDRDFDASVDQQEHEEEVEEEEEEEHGQTEFDPMIQIIRSSSNDDDNDEEHGAADEASEPLNKDKMGR